jgi:hypothetical protein
VKRTISEQLLLLQPNLPYDFDKIRRCRWVVKEAGGIGIGTLKVRSQITEALMCAAGRETVCWNQGVALAGNGPLTENRSPASKRKLNTGKSGSFIEAESTTTNGRAWITLCVCFLSRVTSAATDSGSRAQHRDAGGAWQSFTGVGYSLAVIATSSPIRHSAIPNSNAPNAAPTK